MQQPFLKVCSNISLWGFFPLHTIRWWFMWNVVSWYRHVLVTWYPNVFWKYHLWDSPRMPRIRWRTLFWPNHHWSTRMSETHDTSNSDSTWKSTTSLLIGNPPHIYSQHRSWHYIDNTEVMLCLRKTPTLVSLETCGR
jgi:hypothetical protein